MFNWFDKLLVKIAKKILNKYAPTGEFIAYINEREEKVLKDLGGYGQPINETGVKSFYSLTDAWDDAKNFYDNNKELVHKVGSGLAKAWIDMNDQERKNAVTEKAYNDYMQQVESAGKEAQSAIDLNLTPMTISNVPTTKADVSDFTAVAARGGLMNLPTRHRKRYASQGFVEDDEIEIMDPESVGDFELQKEEGVNIGPMAAFPDTGNPMSNAQQVWESGQIDQGIYQMDFNIFFQSGDWIDYISKEKVQGDMKMASNPDDFMTTDEMQIPQEEIMSMIGAQQAAKGGIIGLRHGGRARYADPDWIVKKSDVEEIPRMGQQATPYASEPPTDALDVMESVIIVTPQGMVSISKEDYAKVMSGEITQEEALANAGYESGIKKIELGNAKGGLPKRVRKAPGGIMNLGGLEKDYRTTGGFVPIGAYEKKDDVPARLSKNEFVMTADAVRAAGGGSINKGAQRMYDTMKHLEASPTAKRMTA